MPLFSHSFLPFSIGIYSHYLLMLLILKYMLSNETSSKTIADFSVEKVLLSVTGVECYFLYSGLFVLFVTVKLSSYM